MGDWGWGIGGGGKFRQHVSCTSAHVNFAALTACLPLLAQGGRGGGLHAQVDLAQQSVGSSEVCLRRSGTKKVALQHLTRLASMLEFVLAEAGVLMFLRY